MALKSLDIIIFIVSNLYGAMPPAVNMLTGAARTLVSLCRQYDTKLLRCVEK